MLLSPFNRKQSAEAHTERRGEREGREELGQGHRMARGTQVESGQVSSSISQGATNRALLGQECARSRISLAQGQAVSN